jgi:hypothetical protein
MEANTLRERLIQMPEDSVMFRTDFPEYHSEFVGSVLSELTEEGILVKLAQGIYAKPRRSKFGPVTPSVDKIATAIAIRDNAKILPTSNHALNLLGLSTQVPMRYTYLTTGSNRVIKLAHQEIEFKRSVPKNFCYSTRIIALLVQALRTLKEPNIGVEERQIIQQLISKEPNQEALVKDVAMMPGWMKRIVKPMINFKQNVQTP